MDRARFCVLLTWISCACSTKLHYDARVTVKHEGITRFSFEDRYSGLVKMVSTSGSIIWMGRNETLYSITPAQNPKLVNVSLCKDESADSNCSYKLSLLSQSADGRLLFFCGSASEKTKCCYLNSSYSLIDCFKLDNYEPIISEPSLLVGDMLYFTLPEMGKGLFRVNKDKEQNIWSQATQTELKYLKLIAGKGKHEDKVYSFFAEKHKSKDGESDQWVPQVSQSCKNDRGGPKAQLQNSWTSMIYARLSCGRGYDFTQLVDVATLQTDDDIKIYALFRNYWNMSAVCVYNMTKISTIFTSSQFNSSGVPADHRPGACVANSASLSSEVLKFMSGRPEMKDWVMPENGPLLFRHRHYTHIQVDRAQHDTVLLLSLESGGVHKVLEKSVFVIAEYLPFAHGTHITSMLLDASEKRLLVSSSDEVVQIDLQACGVYGDECSECLLSQDPYCAWSGIHCTTTAEGRGKDPQDCKMPSAEPSRTESRAESVIHVPPSSSHFLLCPMTSHHATYHWLHGHRREECVRSDQGCLYLIERMNETHEGSYTCLSSENVYNRTVAHYELSLSRSNAHRLTPVVLLLLMVMSLPVLDF
ncbi:hypothetical protein R3I94_008621 [Phoxinus phoxinus]